MNGKSAAWVVGVTLLAVFVQATWVSVVPTAGEWADLSLVTAILCGLLFGTEPGLAAGMTAGLSMALLVDTAALAFFLSRVFVAWLMGRLREGCHAENVLVQVAAVAVGSLLCEAVFVVLYPPVLGLPRCFERILLRALLNAVAAVLVAPLLDKLPVEREVTA